MKCHSENSFAKLISIGNELRRSSSISYMPEPLRGLSAMQMTALAYISDHEKDGVFQKDIEVFLRIRRSSVSALLNTLEKSRLITRVPVPEDARRKKVALTDKGSELCHVVEHFHGEVEQFMKRVLSAQELEMLANILEKLMLHFDAFHNAQAERGSQQKAAE